MAWHPRASDDLFIFDNGDGTYRVATPTGTKDMLLNEGGAYLLSLCDGKRSVEAITALLAASSDVPEKEARTWIEAFLVTLRQAGLLHDQDPRRPGVSGAPRASLT